MMLVRISLALNAVFSQAQSPAQAAPPSVPSSSVSTSAQRESQSMMLTASALPARAPMSSWPSAPMFQMRALYTTARPSAQSRIGSALTSSSETP